MKMIKLKINGIKPTRLDLDPTKQSGTRRRAMANIRRKLLNAKREVQALVKSLPSTLVANRTTYTYELDDFRLQTVDERIRDIINKWFETMTSEHVGNTEEIRNSLHDDADFIKDLKKKL